MTTFEMQLARWNASERQAQAAEQALALALDLYCEGLGPVPTREEIEQAQGLRQQARAALQQLWSTQAYARRTLRVL